MICLEKSILHLFNVSMLLKDHLYIILMSVNVVNVEVPGQQRPGRPGVGQLELVSPDDDVLGSA